MSALTTCSGGTNLGASGCSLHSRPPSSQKVGEGYPRHKHFDMDFSNVDIEDVGFDRPCTKDVHGSLGTLDIHIIMVRLERENSSNMQCRIARTFCLL